MNPPEKGGQRAGLLFQGDSCIILLCIAHWLIARCVPRPATSALRRGARAAYPL
jgi:hypothetical protein